MDKLLKIFAANPHLKFTFESRGKEGPMGPVLYITVEDREKDKRLNCLVSKLEMERNCEIVIWELDRMVARVNLQAGRPTA